VTLSRELAGAVDRGELVFPVDVEGRGSIREVRTRPNSNQPCVGAQGSSKPISVNLRDGAEFNLPRGAYKHGAVDIFGGVGTYCYAVEDAVVELMEPGGNAGPHGMRLRGRFGVWLYSHMSDRDVEDGDVVQAGDLVGRLGAEGNVYGCPHLHFGWRAPRATGNGGRQLDPAELLRGLFARATGQREPADSEGPTVDGEPDLESFRSSIEVSERVLLALAAQWERADDDEIDVAAMSLRNAVQMSRDHWRERPAETLDMLRATEGLALDMWNAHPELFERPSMLRSLNESLDMAREALSAAGMAGVGIGLGGLALILFLAAAAGGAFGR
jgi:hypothetical protein